MFPKPLFENLDPQGLDPQVQIRPFSWSPVRPVGWRPCVAPLGFKHPGTLGRP